MPTKIPYVDEAWNIAVGCTKIAPGCLHCWSEELHTKRHKAKLAGKHVAQQYARSFSEVQFLPERMEQPLHWRKPRDIFVCSQSDLFHKEISDNQIHRAFGIMAAARQHRYFVFTKRVERANELLHNYQWTFSGENIWLMLSISTQKEADEKIPILLETNVAHRGLSIEPWLEDIELTRLVMPGTARNDFGDATLSPLRIQAGHYSIGDISPLEWIIVGCESGAKRRPCPIEGVRRIVRDCQAAKVAVWCKQLDIDGVVRHEMKYFPEDLQIQQKP